MTLIVLNNTDYGMMLYTDSRISNSQSQSGRKITDQFTKGFVVPFHFTVKKNPQKIKNISGDVGFGFSGSTIAGTAIAMMSGNILSNMHSDDKRAVPTYDTIVRVMLRATEVLHDETLANPIFFEALIFGYCPMTGKSRTTLLTANNPKEGYRYQAKEINLPIGGVVSIGSGSKYFNQIIKRDQIKNRRIGDIVYEAVRTNPDKATGGAIQIVRVDKSGGKYCAVLEPHVKGGGDSFVSGFRCGELGKIDGFHLGREAIGVGLDIIKANHDMKNK
jgi:hypothetical protein